MWSAYLICKCLILIETSIDFQGSFPKLIISKYHNLDNSHISYNSNPLKSLQVKL